MELIPHELCDTQCDVCLYIDIMYVNGMPFLTTISEKIKYHTATWVADCNAPTIASLVESVLKLYQRAGFQVMEVCANQEFKPVLHILQDSGWSFRPIPYESPNQSFDPHSNLFFETVRFQIPSKLRLGTLNRDFVAWLCPGMYQVKGIQSFNMKFLRGRIHSFFNKIPPHSCD